MRFYYVLAAGLLCGAALPIQARTLDFKESVARGYLYSPFAAQTEKVRLEAIGPETDDTKLLNPGLEYTYNIDGKEHEAKLEQPLRISDITLARRDYRKQLSERNTLEKELDKLRIYHQTAASYYDLYILQEREKFKREHLAFLNKVSQIVHGSINHNNLSAAEIYTFDADILATKTDLQLLNADLQSARTAFARYLNLPDEKIALRRPPEIKLAVPLKSILKRIGDFPTQRQMLAMNYEQARQKLKISGQDRYMPVISPEVVYGFNDREGEDEFKVGVTLSIPLWNRLDGTYSALKAGEKAAERELNALDEVTFEALVARAYQKLEAQIGAVKRYAGVILPDYRNSVQKTEASFANGQFTIFDVWQIREKYLEAQKNYLELLRGALAAKTELETLIGARLEDLQK